MNGKIMAMSIAMVLMLLTLSVVSATNIAHERKESKTSPLFEIRTGMAINEKIKQIKSKFFLGRIFLVQNLNFDEDNLLIRNKLTKITSNPMIHSCEYPFCSFVPCMNQNQENEVNVRDMLPCKPGYYSRAPYYTQCI